jgi:hypothetical protein
MKHVKNYVAKVALVMTVLFAVSSCDIFDLDINKNPNAPTTVTPDLLLPQVMLNGSYGMQTLANNGDGFVGASITWNDSHGLQFTSFTGTWSYFYANILKNLDGVLKYVEANATVTDGLVDGAADGGPLARYYGVAQILKAYYFSALVDSWGDVPYFTAFNADNVATPEQNPVYDDAAAVYTDLLGLLDKAVTNLSVTSSINLGAADPIYGGSTSSWQRAARSLKVRLLLQVRNNPGAVGVTDVNAEIGALVTAGVISSTAQDWQFQYGTTNVPDYRHPWYQSGYAGATNNFTYMMHEQMVEMLVNKDPRWLLYYKRQTKTILNPDNPDERNTMPCVQTQGCTYGYVPLSAASVGKLYVGRDGFPPGDPNDTGDALVTTADPAALTTAEKEFLAGVFGRDRGDISGIPADPPLRTGMGTWPAAGFYDDVNPTIRKMGGNRAYAKGIFVMIGYYNMQLYLAERELVFGTTAAARTHFQNAMTAQMDKVYAFAQSIDASAISSTANAPANYKVVTPYSTATRDAYITARLAQFDAAATANGRMDVIMREAAIMNFGNGMDTWNSFRRTGLPVLTQPLVHTRQFTLRLPYSQTELTLNTNAPSPAPEWDNPANKLFWDNIGYQFPN